MNLTLWQRLRHRFSRGQRQLSRWFGGRRSEPGPEAEIEAELRSHIELRTQANREAGMSEREARRTALEQFGWRGVIQEECLRQRRWHGLEPCVESFRYAARQLLGSPGFTLSACLTLALGIAANTTVFSIARTILFRPLGFAGEERLVWVHGISTPTGTRDPEISWREMEDLQEGMRGFEAVGTFATSEFVWRDGDVPRHVPVLRASAGLGAVLRLRPALGRGFSERQEALEEDTALISAELWESRFASSGDVLGRRVDLDGRSYTVVGVLPRGLTFPLLRQNASVGEGILRAERPAFWIPLPTPKGEDRTWRAARMFPVVARLAPGVRTAEVSAELTALGQRLAEQFPRSNRHRGLGLIGFREQVLGPARQGVPLLAAAVAAVLLICCVNLACLLLARGVTRRRELAVRAALGASHGRLVATQLAESLLLACLGGAVGALLALVTLRLVRHWGQNSVPFLEEANLDGTTLAFTAGLSLLTALVFGLVPALRQARVDPSEALRVGQRSTAGRRTRRWQQSLLVGQIAAVTVLLAASGLLLESFRRLLGQDLGYRPDSVIALELKARGDFPTNADMCRMYRALHERLRALPEVEAVGTVSSIPLTHKWGFFERAAVEGQPVPEADRPSLAATFVAFDYFQAMGIALREGRLFRAEELDDDGYGRNVILNQAAAARLFPGRSAVGGRFTVGSNSDRMLEVIGVVADTRDVRLEEAPQPRMYWQYAFGGAQVLVRARGSLEAVEGLLRHAAQQTDSRIAEVTTRRMVGVVGLSVAERRFLMSMVVAYAVLSLAIAAVGIFGVASYQVAQRRTEFGLRLALGSTAEELMRLVLREACRWSLLGAAVGTVMALGTNRLLVSQLYGLSPDDPRILAQGVAILVLVALVAGLLPAKRAANADPMSVLRSE